MSTAVLLLQACGSGGGHDDSGTDSSGTGTGTGGGSSTPTYVPPTAPADAPGITNSVPATPTAGATRAGTSYDVFIQAPETGDKVAFTVFEPSTLAGGTTYPLVVYSHGFGGTRQSAGNPDANVTAMLAAGYGVISLDERGHGDSGGTIRVMDPDAEGHDLVAILDWAEVRLDWLQFGPSVDGTDPHNLVLGSIGGSYGGMFQYLIHNADPRKRLDAMVPQYAPNNLNESLFPGGVIKSQWDAFLFAAGTAAGGHPGHFDPYVTNGFVGDFAANAEDDGFKDFFYYHSNHYFYGGVPVATNGGAGTTPELAPIPGPKVHAMLFQGVRDTLFNFSEGYHNYLDLKALGGDVRLLSFQTGHNQLQVVPDVGNHVYLPPGNEFDTKCGGIDVTDATVAFFAQYLKGVPGAANAVVPATPCLSIQMGDGVIVDHILTKDEETQIAVPSTTVIAGVPGVPMAVDLGIVGGAAGTVVGGIPHLSVTVAPVAAGTPGEPILFVGLGQTRNGVPGVYDLLNNQVEPIRGAGTFDFDMVGVAARLATGDHLALLIYGLNDQFAAGGSVSVASPAVIR